MRLFADAPAPTLRLYLVGLSAGVPLALGEVAPAFVGIAVGGLVILLALVLADHSAAVNPERLSVERRRNPRLYLAAENSIHLAVTNRGGHPAQIRLRDTPPIEFRSSTLFTGGMVAPGQTAVLTYTTVPTARGLYRFGDVTLRWRTPLGFLWRQTTISLGEAVQVYPNLLEIEKYELFARRGLLREMGLRTSRTRDRGTEFESLREYLPDDDYRRINWKATARAQRPITTLYESERSQRLIIMLDLGRMMLARVGDLTRLDAATNAAVMLAYVALARGDRVGLMAFSDRIVGYTAPRRGRAHFYRIVEQLYDLRAQPIEADYVLAFARARSDLRGRSLLTLFTDLGDPDTARTIARSVAQVARHHLPVCVTLNDPRLLQLASGTPARSRDLYEKLVALRLLEERSVLLEEMARSGVHTVDAPADQLTPRTIDRYLEVKERALL